MRLLDWPKLTSATAPAVGLLGGLFLLALQAYLYLQNILLSSWLIGGGIGLTLVSLMAWYYLLDDRRAGATPQREQELPTADQYEQWFDQVDTSADDKEQPDA